MVASIKIAQRNTTRHQVAAKISRLKAASGLDAVAYVRSNQGISLYLASYVRHSVDCVAARAAVLTVSSIDIIGAIA